MAALARKLLAICAMRFLLFGMCMHGVSPPVYVYSSHKRTHTHAQVSEAVHGPIYAALAADTSSPEEDQSRRDREDPRGNASVLQQSAGQSEAAAPSMPSQNTMAA